MEVLTEKEDKYEEPPFLSLCRLASQEDWCWKITCTTCGHMHFRYGFKALIDGKHPNGDGWPVNKTTRITREIITSLPMLGGFPELEQKTLSHLVEEVPLAHIKAFTKSPDWLGYLGLILIYCDSRKVHLSKVWASQFIDLLPLDSYALGMMQDIERGNNCFSIGTLEAIEQALYGYLS